MGTSWEAKKWRFWPVVCLALLYPANNALIVLAIPLYFYKIGLPLEIIGVLAAGTTMTYCFSPMLANRLSERIGRRKSLVFGVTGIIIAQSIFYLTLDPIPFLFSRIIEGFMSGFVWSNLQSSISDNIEHDHSKYLARYNFSWNFGILSGFLIGTILLFFIRDITLIFYVAPILILSSALIIIFFFQESIKNNGAVNKKVNNEENDDQTELDYISGNIANFTKFSIPIIIPIACIITYCLARTGANFLYPIKSQILGFDAYTVYLISAIGFITQIISITISSYLSLRSVKKIAIISTFALIIVFILLGANTNFYFFIILFIIAGFFVGTLYGISLKLFLVYNIKNNTSKYSGFLESIIGTTFLIGPIVLALIANIDVNFAFYFIALIFLVNLFINLIFIRKIKKIKKKK